MLFLAAKWYSYDICQQGIGYANQLNLDPLVYIISNEQLYLVSSVLVTHNKSDHKMYVFWHFETCDLACVREQTHRPVSCIC